MNSQKNKQIEISKSPINMDYSELDTLLNSLLDLEELPHTIKYRSDKINYQRRNMKIIIIKALFRLICAELFYLTYIRKRIMKLKQSKDIYKSLKKSGCLKSLRTYLYLSKIGQTDLLRYLGGNFDDRKFANFATATTLYDASFDIPKCRKYLKDFDAIIMEDKTIESKDSFLALFNECVDYLRNTLDKKSFEIFANYIKIEHISQLMSIYQHSDKNISKEHLCKITFPKGGISLLALMHLMAPNMEKKQRIAIYEIGGVLQIIDDIKDIKEDLKSGIQTLPNQKLLDPTDMKKQFYGTVNNLMDKCGISQNRPNGTLDMLCWFADVILKRRYLIYIRQT